MTACLSYGLWLMIESCSMENNNAQRLAGWVHRLDLGDFGLS